MLLPPAPTPVSAPALDNDGDLEEQGVSTHMIGIQPSTTHHPVHINQFAPVGIISPAPWGRP